MNLPAGMANKKYAKYEAESIKADCVSDNWQAFFKCGIRIGFKFNANPQRKKSEVIRMMANVVLFCRVAFLFMLRFYLKSKRFNQYSRANNCNE